MCQSNCLRECIKVVICHKTLHARELRLISIESDSDESKQLYKLMYVIAKWKEHMS